MVEADLLNRALSADILTLGAFVLIFAGGVLAFMARGMMKQNVSAGDLAMKLMTMNTAQVDALSKIGSAMDANTASVKTFSETIAKQNTAQNDALKEVADVLGYIKRGLQMMNETGNRTVAGIARIEKENALTADKLDSLMSTVTANSSKLDEVAGVLGQLPDGITGAIERGLSGWVKSTIREEVENILDEREAKKHETSESVVVSAGAVADASGDGEGSSDIRDGDTGTSGDGSGSGESATGDGSGDGGGGSE